MSASSAAQSVRIDRRDADVLTELSERMGQPKTKVMHQALQQLRRSFILDATNNAYAALKNDKQAWASEMAERAELDSALADGLGDD
jgi:predicted transcriptional regulator